MSGLKKYVLASILCFSGICSAADLRIGEIASGGNGCPAGDEPIVRISLASGKGRIYFTNFTAELDGAQTLARASCNFAIPVSVPAGKSLIVEDIDAQWTTKLPDGSKSQLRVESFMVPGAGSTVLEEQWAADGINKIRTEWVFGTQSLSSGCGAVGNLRFNVSTIYSAAQGSGGQSEIQRLNFKLRLVDCPN